MSAYVYFIQAGRGGPIKIGIADDPGWRMGQLQIGSPVELQLLGSVKGDRELERELHERLGRHRLRGEWFRPHKDVLVAMREAGAYAREHEQVFYSNRGERCTNCGAPVATGKLGLIDNHHRGMCRPCWEFRSVRKGNKDPFDPDLRRDAVADGDADVERGPEAAAA